MIGFEPIGGGGGGATTAAQVSYLNGEIVNVQEALDSLLYQAPKINTFTNDVNLVLKGTIVKTVKLDWSFNKTMVSAIINNGVGSVLGQTTFTQTGQNITENKTYTMTANDGTNSVGRNTSLVFENERFSGTSLNGDLATIDISTLQTKEFVTNRAVVKTINGDGKYIYLCHPASLGIPIWTVNGFAFTAVEYIIKPFTNSKGFTENYFIGRLSTVQFGSLTIELK